jgi:hypothetical protein
MNPIQKSIRARLNRLPAELAPLKAACQRCLRYCCAVEIDDATLLLGHQPWVGPEGYLITLFPGAKPAWFSKYHKKTGVKIPSMLQRFLTVSNGCEAFGLSIYGMTPSMLKEGLLDRSARQCLDIGTANRHWKHEFPIDPSYFHFGARDFSDTELAGYFLDSENRIHAIRQGGKAVGVWSSMKTFLHDELAAAEKLACAKVPEAWWH